MSFDIHVSREPQRTRVAIGGQATLGRVLSALQLLQVDSLSWPADEVLLDLSEIDTSLTPCERSQVQDAATARLGPRRIVALRWYGG